MPDEVKIENPNLSDAQRTQTKLIAREESLAVSTFRAKVERIEEKMTVPQKALFEYALTGAYSTLEKAQQLGNITEDKFLADALDIYTQALGTDKKDEKSEEKVIEIEDKDKISIEPKGKVDINPPTHGTETIKYDSEADFPLADKEKYFAWREKKFLRSMDNPYNRLLKVEK